jgi:hypothetical protein
MLKFWSFILISITSFSFSNKENTFNNPLDGQYCEDCHLFSQEPHCNNSQETLLNNKVKVALCYKTTLKKTFELGWFDYNSQVDTLKKTYLFSKTHYNKNGNEILFIQFDSEGKQTFKETSQYYSNRSIKKVKTIDSTSIHKRFLEKDSLPYITSQRLPKSHWWTNFSYYDNNLLETCALLQVLSSHSRNTYDIYEFWYKS